MTTFITSMQQSNVQNCDVIFKTYIWQVSNV